MLTVVQRSFESVLRKSTKDILALTECFARADSAGYMLVVFVVVAFLCTCDIV